MSRIWLISFSFALLFVQPLCALADGTSTLRDVLEKERTATQAVIDSSVEVSKAKENIPN